MGQAFIIMQIGNPELDQVCERVIVPALKACGLDPKRVDKHNQGGLLKSEIIALIEGSDIILADLTNERPNCYLEVGYAMGVDKFRNLILTAREDHNPDSPNHQRGGPRVHFDLAGYDILFWDPNNLDDFRNNLEKRIRRRQAILAPSVASIQSPWNIEWLEKQRNLAKVGLEKSGKSGFMEARFALSGSKANKNQQELLEAAGQSQIHTFHWPIAPVAPGGPARPHPTVDGITAEISMEGYRTYDYWSLRRDGDFYMLKSLFEDERQPNTIFFNTRIVRVTEALLYCARLYSRLGVPSTTTVHVGIRHGGLNGRILGAVGNRWGYLSPRRPSVEDQIETEVHFPLTRIESDLVGMVKELTQPLFMLFDYFVLSDNVYADIVNQFVDGKVT